MPRSPFWIKASESSIQSFTYDRKPIIFWMSLFSFDQIAYIFLPSKAEEGVLNLSLDALGSCFAFVWLKAVRCLTSSMRVSLVWREKISFRSVETVVFLWVQRCVVAVLPSEEKGPSTRALGLKSWNVGFEDLLFCCTHKALVDKCFALDCISFWTPLLRRTGDILAQALDSPSAKHGTEHVKTCKTAPLMASKGLERTSLVQSIVDHASTGPIGRVCFFRPQPEKGRPPLKYRHPRSTIPADSCGGSTFPFQKQFLFLTTIFPYPAKLGAFNSQNFWLLNAPEMAKNGKILLPKLPKPQFWPIFS